MFEKAKVYEWMTTPVITVLPSVSLSAASDLMREYNVRRLIVTENETVVGILTLGDVREARPSDATTLSIWELNYLWSQLTVEQVMPHTTFTIGPNDSMVDAADLMLEHKISGLPVVDSNNVLVGVISEADIFRMIVKSRLNSQSPVPANV
jgi:CBS domain-containing protein